MAQFDTAAQQQQQQQQQQPPTNGVNAYGEPVLQNIPTPTSGSLQDLSDFDNDHQTQMLLDMSDATNTVYGDTVNSNGGYRRPEGLPPQQPPQMTPQQQQAGAFPAQPQPTYLQQPQNYNFPQGAYPQQGMSPQQQQPMAQQLPQGFDPRNTPGQQPMYAQGDALATHQYPEYQFRPPTPEQVQQFQQTYAQGITMPQSPGQQTPGQLPNQQQPISPVQTPNQPYQQQLSPQQLAELQEVRQAMQSEDMRLALGLVRNYNTDPVGFVKTYMKDELQQILGEQQIQGEDPTVYAETFAEQKLKTEFGEDFDFDPSEALEKGTQSYDYERKRQTYFHQGLTAHARNQAQKEAQRQQETMRNEQALTQQLAAAGISPQLTTQFKALLEQIPYTPETYWDMVINYANQKGLLNGLRTPQHNPQMSYIPQQQNGYQNPQYNQPPQQPQYQPYIPPQQLPREVQPLPLPGVAQIPGRQDWNTNQQTPPTDGVDEFPRGFLTEDEF